jgi:hypothetical protein
MAVGFKQYGKTTYLSELTLLLERSASVIPSMWYETLDKESFNAIRNMRDTQDRTAPETPVGSSRPLLIRVHDMGDLGSHCLILHDLAGESFEVPDKVGESAPALRQVNTVWFLVSLSNLEKDHPRRTILELLTVYLAGMEELRIDVRGTNLIVVYTKADEVSLFPEDLRDYLIRDPLTPLAQTETWADGVPELAIGPYQKEMLRVSDRLEELTRLRVPHGALFINRVHAKGMNLVFSLVSALGQKPDPSGVLGHEKAPRRVIDPLIWALTLERTRILRSLRLVLDVPRGSDGLPEGLIADLWWRLTDHGEVTTHILGQSRPLSSPGQAPPASAGGRSRQRLLGPILLACAPEERLLVLTGGPILDLPDFRNSEWSDRILLVATREDLSLDWELSEICRSGEDVGFLVDRLLSL